MNCVYCGATEEKHTVMHPFIPVNHLILGVYRLEYNVGYSNIFGIYICDVRLMNYIANKEIYFGELSGKHSEISFEPGEYTKLLTTDGQLITDLVTHGIFVGINPVRYYMENLTNEEEINDLKEHLK